jgi:hypothetical protein
MKAEAREEQLREDAADFNSYVLDTIKNEGVQWNERTVLTRLMDRHTKSNMRERVLLRDMFKLYRNELVCHNRGHTLLMKMRKKISEILE